MLIMCNKSIDLKECRLDYLTKVFFGIVRDIFQQFVKEAIYEFSDRYMKNGILAKMLGCEQSELTWKSRNGNRERGVLSLIGWIKLPQIQVQIKDKETKKKKKVYITRVVLGLEKYKRIPISLVERFGFTGAMASFRPTVKIIEMFSGIKTNVMTILRSVRQYAQKIKFGIDPNQKMEFEADGTGIPVPLAGERGSELKVFTQRLKRGGIRIAGLAIGKYKQGWEKIVTGLKNFVDAVLVTDGDKSISKSLENTAVTIQTCLWHVVHGLKYTLRTDGLSSKKNEADFSYAVDEVSDIVNTKVFKNKTPSQQKMLIRQKEKRLDDFIAECKTLKLKGTISYLQNLKPYLFAAVGKIKSFTTSRTERVMRNVNQRINIATWSDQGSLAVSKIRLAYYYNGLGVK